MTIKILLFVAGALIGWYLRKLWVYLRDADGII